MSKRTPRSSSVIFAACLASAALMAAPLIAKPQEVRVRSEGDLRFGTFMVFGTGSRSVSATGAVVDMAIVALEGGQPRPARFTIEYDRGNESKQALEVTLEVVLSAPSTVRVPCRTSNMAAASAMRSEAIRAIPCAAPPSSTLPAISRCRRKAFRSRRACVTPHLPMGDRIPTPLSAAPIACQA